MRLGGENPVFDHRNRQSRQCTCQTGNEDSSKRWAKLLLSLSLILSLLFEEKILPAWSLVFGAGLGWCGGVVGGGRGGRTPGRPARCTSTRRRRHVYLARRLSVTRRRGGTEAPRFHIRGGRSGLHIAAENTQQQYVPEYFRPQNLFRCPVLQLIQSTKRNFRMVHTAIWIEKLEASCFFYFCESLVGSTFAIGLAGQTQKQEQMSMLWVSFWLQWKVGVGEPGQVSPEYWRNRHPWEIGLAKTRDGMSLGWGLPLCFG